MSIFIHKLCSPVFTYLAVNISRSTRLHRWRSMVCLSLCTSQFMLICVSRNINVCHCLCLFITDIGGGMCVCRCAFVCVCVCVCVCVWVCARCRGGGGVAASGWNVIPLSSTPLQPPHPVFAPAHVLFRLLSLSFLSPVWTEVKRLQGKLQRRKLVRLSLRKSNQFVPTSPVVKKCSIDQPIRTESTESFTDWANRMGARRFLPIINTAAWKNTEISPYSQTTSLANSCLWVLWHFFQIEHKKVIDVYPKVTNCSFNF